MEDGTDDTVDYNFVRGQFTETKLEAAIIYLFQEQDYAYVPGDTIHRGFEETLLKDDSRVYRLHHCYWV